MRGNGTLGRRNRRFLRASDRSRSNFLRSSQGPIRAGRVDDCAFRGRGLRDRTCSWRACGHAPVSDSCADAGGHPPAPVTVSAASRGGAHGPPHSSTTAEARAPLRAAPACHRTRGPRAVFSPNGRELRPPASSPQSPRRYFVVSSTTSLARSSPRGFFGRDRLRCRVEAQAIRRQQNHGGDGSPSTCRGSGSRFVDE